MTLKSASMLVLLLSPSVDRDWVHCELPCPHYIQHVLGAQDTATGCMLHVCHMFYTQLSASGFITLNTFLPIMCPHLSLPRVKRFMFASSSVLCCHQGIFMTQKPANLVQCSLNAACNLCFTWLLQWAASIWLCCVMKDQVCAGFDRA